MLEVSPSLTSRDAAAGDPPARHRRQGRPGAPRLHRRPGPAVVVAMSDLRDRFRLVANVVENVEAPDLPNLPVGRAVWRPAPDFATSAACWLAAGAAHHTVMTTAVGIEVWRDFAEIARTELVVIDETHDSARLPRRAAVEPGVLPARPRDLTGRDDCGRPVTGDQHGPALRRLRGRGRERRRVAALADLPWTRPGRAVRGRRAATRLPWRDPGAVAQPRRRRSLSLRRRRVPAAAHRTGRGRTRCTGWSPGLEFEPVDVDDSHVALATTIEPQAGYPWRVLVETTYALGADGLTQTVCGTNMSSEPAPWGTGPHPYLVAGPGPLDDWILGLPAEQVLEVTAGPAGADPPAAASRRPPRAFRLPSPRTGSETFASITPSQVSSATPAGSRQYVCSTRRGPVSPCRGTPRARGCRSTRPIWPVAALRRVIASGWRSSR